MLQPASPGSFVWFSLICSRRRGSTAAVVTLETVGDESRKKMAHSVTRPPARRCSSDGRLCFHVRLVYEFCLVCDMLPTFLALSFLTPVCLSSCSFVCAPVICYSLQVPSMFPVFLVAFVSCLISEFLCFYLFSTFLYSLFSGDGFVVLSYPVR